MVKQLISDSLSNNSFFSYYCLELELFEHCTALDTHGFCQTCADTFVLNPTLMRCAKGGIGNCRVYKDPTTCSVCEDNYLIGLSDKFCLQRVAENCKSIKSDKDECLECKDGFWMLKETVDAVTKETCKSYTVKDCLESDATQDRCTKCHVDEQLFGKYLDAADGKCKEHRAVENCVEYLSSTNGCAACKTGYYIDPNDVQLCQKNPNGIENCEVYVSESQCRYCKTGFSPDTSGKSCTPVTGSIDKCVYYIDSDTCAECSPGSVFVASNGTQVVNGES